MTEIKEKWRGMVSSADKVHSKIATDRQKTGGGSKPVSPKGENKKTSLGNTHLSPESREELNLVSL